MKAGSEAILSAVCRVAADVPFSTVELIAELFDAAQYLKDTEMRLITLPHPHYRAMASRLVETCQHNNPNVDPKTVAIALRTAAWSEKVHRKGYSVEPVWTGPDADAIP